MEVNHDEIRRGFEKHMDDMERKLKTLDVPTQEKIAKMLAKGEKVLQAGRKDVSDTNVGNINTPKELGLIVKTEIIDGFPVWTSIGWRCPTCGKELKDNITVCPYCRQLICDD